MKLGWDRRGRGGSVSGGEEPNSLKSDSRHVFNFLFVLQCSCGVCCFDAFFLPLHGCDLARPGAYNSRHIYGDLRFVIEYLLDFIIATCPTIHGSRDECFEGDAIVASRTATWQPHLPGTAMLCCASPYQA